MWVFGPHAQPQLEKALFSKYHENQIFLDVHNPKKIALINRPTNAIEKLKKKIHPETVFK